MSRVNRFVRCRFGRKPATYVCNCCGKRTRETGEEESTVDLCAACYWDGQIDILQWDNQFPAEMIAAWEVRREAMRPNTPKADTKGLRGLYEEMYRFLRAAEAAKGGAA